VQKEAGEQNKGLHNPEGTHRLLTDFPGGLPSGIANERCTVFSELLWRDAPPMPARGMLGDHSVRLCFASQTPGRS